MVSRGGDVVVLATVLRGAATQLARAASPADTGAVAAQSGITLTVHNVILLSEGGADWTPPDPENFRVDGMVFAGANPDGPGDSFDFQLCTPRWLADHFDDHVPMSGPILEHITSPHDELPLIHGVGHWWFADDQVLIPRGLILVRRWDPVLLERAVREAFGTVTAPTWRLAADRVGRLVPWEFAYRHDEAVDQTALDS